MNLCWIVPKGERGHVRDVDPDEHADLLRDGYEDIRLTCVTPSGQREGVLYDQASMNAHDLASHVEKAGLALFGGCTTIRVAKADRAAVAKVRHSESPHESAS